MRIEIKRTMTASAIAIVLGGTGGVAMATEWVTTYDPALYNGTTAVITFNDWGYTGPAGVGANDFQVGGGFDAGNIGQIQHVITKEPDWLTPDPPHTVYGDLYNTPTYSNANMDGGVNFYKWAYTTPADSTFSNMQIDKAGNYYIAKSDMSFGYYDYFEYRDTTGTNPDATLDTRINFQPYTISDAMGWCGSTLVTDPNGVEQMAGQVTFDFAMDVYFDFGGAPSYSSTQLISGFVMRSYGDYSIDVTMPNGDNMVYSGSAVGNNTNPTSIVPGVGGELDPEYHNQVSFLGGGVVPLGAWVSADSFNSDGSRKMRVDYNPTTGESGLVWDVTLVEEGTEGAVWHSNSFAGYGFLLRADGMRFLDYANPDGHSIYLDGTSEVPLPAAVWLFGSGLLGLVGLARRKAA